MARSARPQAVATNNTAGGSSGAAAGLGDRYKWVVLSNMLLAGLIVSIDSTIVLIGMPAIFRGVHVNPLAAGNTKYMLWMIMGFLIVTAVLVVSLGRLGDIYGRVRVYNLGFAVFTVFSILLSVSWLSGTALGIMTIRFVARSTVGLVLGGVLAPISWRLIFLVSVPVGLFGTIWSYMSLRDIGERRAAHIDWWGNLTFALA